MSEDYVLTQDGAELRVALKVGSIVMTTTQGTNVAPIKLTAENAVAIADALDIAAEELEAQNQSAEDPTGGGGELEG